MIFHMVIASADAVKRPLFRSTLGQAKNGLRDNLLIMLDIITLNHEVRNILDGMVADAKIYIVVMLRFSCPNTREQVKMGMSLNI